MDTTRHRGRTAIVTGAGSGIGEASAIRFAREGALVIGADVNAEGLEATRKQIEAAGGQCRMIVGDITVEADVARIVEAAKASGRVDVLANVAGIMDHFLTVAEVDDATWERVFAVNVTAQMRLLRRIVPIMTAAGGGAIVNVSSLAGVGLGVSGAAYAASKHAVVGLTLQTAYHYAPQKVRVNAVCPGGVSTNIGRTSAPKSELGFERGKLSMARNIRSAEPDEIAALISWLASDEASDVNGAVIKSDAGWTAG